MNEILDLYSDKEIIFRLTFTKELNNMLYNSIFMPFMSSEAPMISNIGKSDLLLDYLKPNPDLVRSILRARAHIQER